MSNEPDREVVVHFPKELALFFEGQLQFLTSCSVVDPVGEFIDSALFITHDLLKFMLSNCSLQVPCVSGFPRFVFEVTLENIAALSATEEYVVNLPYDRVDFVKEIKQVTPCVSDEEVILCCLCCFQWLIEVYKSRSNLFVLDNEGNETVYHLPILSTYKAALLH